MSDNLMKWNPLEAQSSKNVLNNLGLVSEMSIPLKRFRERSDGIRLPLIRHWCLCKWCQLFDKENQNLNHWKDEVFAFIDDLQSIDIKNGISKKKTLTNMWLISTMQTRYSKSSEGHSDAKVLRMNLN